jgi:hypothetical protein
MKAVKTVKTKRPCIAWKEKYQAPNSKNNSTRCWVLPPSDELLDDFRACGGQVDVLVSALSKNTKRKQLLLAQIFERLNEKTFAAQWQNVSEAAELAAKVMPHIKVIEIGKALTEAGFQPKGELMRELEDAVKLAR